MVAQVDFAAAEAAATPIAGNALNLALVQLDSGGASLVLGNGTAVTALTLTASDATNVTGTVGASATGTTQAAGTADTTIATTAFATNQDIGVGQTWQSVTRAIGGSYTNSTGKPIQIAVTVSHAAAGSSALLTVGGVAVANTFDDSSRRQIISAVIPNGASYGVTQASGTIALNNWTELR